MSPFESSEARVRYVRVTNRNTFDFSDRHDGVPVKIPPGKSENLPPDMAEHFFGCHIDPQNPAAGFDEEAMMRHVCRRQGWNTIDFVKPDPETGKTKAQLYFANLSIEPVLFKLVQVDEADPRDPIPADPDVSLEDMRAATGRKGARNEARA